MDRLLRQALQADRFEVARDERVQALGWHRVVVEHLEDSFKWRFAAERRAPGEQLVEDRAERVHVGRGADVARPPARLFRGDVARGTHHSAGARADVAAERFVEPLRESEVGDLRDEPGARGPERGTGHQRALGRLALGVQEHVARFQVAVNDARGVRELHRSREDLDQLGGALVVPRGAAEVLREAPAFNKFQRQVRVPAGLADVENLDDVRVLERGDRFGLALEPLALGRSGVDAGQDHLQRDGAVQVQLPGLVNDPHPPAPDLVQNLVARDLWRDEIDRVAGPERHHTARFPPRTRLGRVRLRGNEPGERFK